MGPDVVGPEPVGCPEPFRRYAPGYAILFALMDPQPQPPGARRAPALRPEDEDMAVSSWMDPENFNPGYLMRSMHLLPRRGDKPEWQHTQDYWAECNDIPDIDLEDPIFNYD